ncbi:hypothetical protein [Mesorhizobium cantuariense]|uniref:Uncharacterized protein n=1 Tax=Mesorhizobium cantuariense TaxID=1300275 RepID=A0ABV7N0Z7_9HYPH
MAVSKGRKGPTDPGKPSDVDLTMHPLVTRLNPDGDSPPSTLMLVGYLGPSKKSGRIRLYLDLTFTGYVEISTEAIVATHPVNKEDENSPTQVFILDDATLDLVHNVVQTVGANYLRGRIAEAHMAAAKPAGAPLANNQRVAGTRASANNAEYLAGTFELGCYTLAGTLCLTCTPTFICPQ